VMIFDEIGGSGIADVRATALSGERVTVIE
jgi:hypothetical protein